MSANENISKTKYFTKKGEKIKKIDCTKAKDYLRVRAAATKIDENGFCRIHCDDCILKNQDVSDHCETVEYLHPDIAIELMQKFADEHPDLII